MHLGDPSPPGAVPYEMQDHRQSCRQLAVQRGPIEAGGRAQGLQTGRYIGRRVRMDGAFSELANMRPPPDR